MQYFAWPLFIFAQLCCISRSSGRKLQAIVALKKAKQLKWLLGKQLGAAQLGLALGVWVSLRGRDRRLHLLL